MFLKKAFCLFTVIVIVNLYEFHYNLPKIKATGIFVLITLESITFKSSKNVLGIHHFK